jgi:hypothetical protein
MQVIDIEPTENILDRIGEPWSEEEDKLLLRYRLNNKTPNEIGVLLHRNEFAINLRIHLIIFRLHRNGLTASQIRLITNAELTQILDIIQPINTRKPIHSQYYHNWFDWTTIWNNIWNSF